VIRNSEKNNDPVANRFKEFSGTKKLELALELYYSAWELKKAALKHFYPQLSDKEFEDKVREIFLYART